jgi:hypothetical protein
MELLQAVNVNWRIDLSTPFLALSALENGCVEISFGANFGPHVENQDDQSQEWSEDMGFQEVAIAEYPFEIVEKDFNRYQYQKVKIVFDSFNAVRMLSPQTEFSAIDHKKYDLSSILFFDLLCQDNELWAKEFYSYWKENNICPDPRMYEVKKSRWLDETKAERFGCKHFILLGHDNYIEVLAKDWNWQSIGGIPNW